jgi:hypothetical protein
MTLREANMIPGVQTIAGKEAGAVTLGSVFDIEQAAAWLTWREDAAVALGICLCLSGGSGAPVTEEVLTQILAAATAPHGEECALATTRVPHSRMPTTDSQEELRALSLLCSDKHEFGEMAAGFVRRVRQNPSATPALYASCIPRMMRLIDTLGIRNSVYALAFMWLADKCGDEETAEAIGKLAAEAGVE